MSARPYRLTISRSRKPIYEGKTAEGVVFKQYPAIRHVIEWRWRITHGNQHIVAASSEGFRHFNSARDNAASVTGLDLRAWNRDLPNKSRLLSAADELIICWRECDDTYWDVEVNA